MTPTLHFVYTMFVKLFQDGAGVVKSMVHTQHQIEEDKGLRSSFKSQRNLPGKVERLQGMRHNIHIWPGIQ
jgi:hypothetical protein